jgi:hypothetical protein
MSRLVRPATATGWAFVGRDLGLCCVRDGGHLDGVLQGNPCCCRVEDVTACTAS